MFYWFMMSLDSANSHVRRIPWFLGLGMILVGLQLMALQHKAVSGVAESASRCRGDARTTTDDELTDDQSTTAVRLLSVVSKDCCSIAVAENGTAIWDFSCSPGERYGLIVSSLGDAETRYTAALGTATDKIVSAAVPTHVRMISLASLPANAGYVVDRPTSGVETIPRERTFFVHVAEGDLADRRRYAEVRAKVVKSTSRLSIYWDEQLTFEKRYQRLIEDLAAQMEEDVIPEIGRRLGDVYDTDGDGRFTILLTPWLDRLEGGKTSLRGMVRATDFRTDLPLPFSHQMDMLYLNPLATPDVQWRDILMHEYTHAVCCSWRMRQRPDGSTPNPEADWIQEGMAHTLEPLGANQDRRLAAYLYAPQDYPLVVADYYRAGLWRTGGCRGATSLFHRWLADFGGDGCLRSLMMSSVQGTQNIETVTGCSFEDLFRLWTIELLGVHRAPVAIPTNAVRHFPDLHGRVGRYALHGPRLRDWNVDGAGESIELKGTTASFWVLSSDSHIARRRLKISGPASMRLQVTLVRLPDTFPQMADETAASIDQARTPNKSVADAMKGF